MTLPATPHQAAEAAIDRLRGRLFTISSDLSDGVSPSPDTADEITRAAAQIAALIIGLPAEAPDFDGPAAADELMSLSDDTTLSPAIRAELSRAAERLTEAERTRRILMAIRLSELSPEAAQAVITSRQGVTHD